MSKYQAFIETCFHSIKDNNGIDSFGSIPIYDAEKLLVGHLQPITKEYQTAMPDCVSLLAKWRNENPVMSLEPFEATIKSTKEWLDNAVLARSDRILFMIIAADGTKVGHIGFSSFVYEEKCCEVDAVLRGISGYKGMMSFALQALLHWGITYLKLKNIQLRVVSDNHRAINFYINNCFYRIESEKSDKKTTKKHYIYLQLNTAKWEIFNMP